MKKSNIKSIIREVILESLFGKQVSLVVGNNTKFPGLISKNTRPGEEPYRFTWFSKGKEGYEPMGHVELDKNEMDTLISTKKFSREDEQGIQRTFFTHAPLSISFEAPKIVETLNESMNIHVAGANYERTDKLDELVNHLLRKAISPVLHDIPEDQQNYFRKNSVGYYNMLTADGSYYSNKDNDPSKGIINLYIDGIMSQSLQKMLKGIFEELRKLGVKWGKIKKEQSGVYKSQVIRIPITDNTSKKYAGPPEVNLSNQNAILMFRDVLQYEMNDYTFTMDAKELIERIDSITHDPNWVNQNVRPTTVDKTDPEVDAADSWKDEPPKGGATIINFGVDESYIKQRLQQIRDVAEWAVKNKLNKIYVG